MSKKTLWLALSSLMVLSLLIAACGPAATPTTPETPTAPTTPTTPTTPTAPTTPTTPAAPTTDVPKYGGTLTLSLTTDVNTFDAIYTNLPTVIYQTNEELWTGDWARGTAGTGEVQWDISGSDVWEYKAGALAESWDISAPDTATFHLRKGVRFALDPKNEASKLVAGREVTADDVIYTLKRLINAPQARLGQQPELKQAEISAPDKYTVVFKFRPEAKAETIYRFADYAHIVAHEVVEKYGDLSKWQNQVGTGPFILTDSVPGSQVTFVKNQTHWRTDPVGPGKGNQLPYVDKLMMLILPDASTREAAFRTGKLDDYRATWDVFPTFNEEHPELKWVRIDLGGGAPLSINTQNKQYSDIRVRRALMMAIDWDSLVKYYFGGVAEIVTWPIMYNSQYAKMFLGLDDPDCPDSVKELYRYNPDKAKALLKEAGYPNGFKAVAECSSTADNVDYLSVIKDMWSKVGIDMEIKPSESAVWNKRMNSLLWEDVALTTLGGHAAQLTQFTAMYGDTYINQSRVNDPVIAEALPKVQHALAYGTQAEAMGIYRELLKYVLDQAYAIPRPAPPQYEMWWPWLKNFHGESSVGTWNSRTWTTWVWLDQELKKKMGY